MKRYTLLLSFLLLFSCSSKYKIEKDLTFYELKGNVNHVTLYHYLAQEEAGKIIKGAKDYSGEQDQTISFNKNGFVTQVYYYGRSDSLDTKVVRELVNKNRCLGEKKYNIFDRVIAQWVMSYDDRGHEILRGTVLNNGSVFNYSFLEYDEKDNMISKKNFRYIGSTAYDSLYWVYDNKNRQIREDRYTQDGLQSVSKLEYPGKAKLPTTISIYNSSDELKNIIKTDYNKYGHMVQATQFTPDSVRIAEIKIQYEYDKQRNWIKKTQFLNGEAKSLVERNIIYY